MAVNKFSDWSEEEFNRLLGFKHSGEKELKKQQTVFEPIPEGATG